MADPIEWREGGELRRARWRCENDVPPPASLHVVGDELRADVALARLKAGEVLLYRGDFRNARQLLTALQRRLEKKRPHVRSGEPREVFFADREAKAHEAAILGRLVIALDDRYAVQCASAPDVRAACVATFGDAPVGWTVVSLRELLGLIGAHEWQVKGIPVPALGGSIHPRYGVFGPIRQEYVELVAAAPEVTGKRAFDVGTGTGVLAILLAKKGAARVIATDLDPRAVACARENVERFGVGDRVSVEERDLLPEGVADLIVFNPPWLPAKPKTRIDRAIYDEGGKTLRRFFAEAPKHLAPGGELWLVISDLAERIGIRVPGLLEEVWAKAGLELAWKKEARPAHQRAADEDDPLHEARSQEVTTLYCLTALRTERPRATGGG